MASNIPKVGEIWRHTVKNLDYLILNVSGRTVHTNPPQLMIHYKGLYTDPIYGKNPQWYRFLSDWNTQTIIYGKGEQPRFIKISDSSSPL